MPEEQHTYLKIEWGSSDNCLVPVKETMEALIPKIIISEEKPTDTNAIWFYPVEDIGDLIQS